MKDYLARPPVFQAEQWDGTTEKAMEISSAVEQHFGHVSVQIINRLTLGNSHYIEFTWPDGYIKDEFKANRLYKDDWVVLGPNWMVELLACDEFERRYYPKDVTNELQETSD